MSRGPGKWQRFILDALQKPAYVLLAGNNRSETTALLRAAKKLEAAGSCVVVRAWNDGHTRIQTTAWRPDATFGGKPLKEISVERVPSGTGATFTRSLRHIARQMGIGKTQAWRDWRKGLSGRPQ